MSAVAGWYTDPGGVTGQLRWWDGDRWTDHVTPDPAYVAPEPEPEPEPVPEPVAEPAPEPEPEPVAEPVTEPEPVAEAVPDPVTEPGRTPWPTTPDVAAQPVAEPSGDPPAAETSAPDQAPDQPTDEPAAGTPSWQREDVAPAPVWGAGPSAAGASGVGAAAVWGSGAGSAGPGTSPPPPPGAPPPPGVAEAAAAGSPNVNAWGDAPSAPSWEVNPRSSGNGVRTGLIIAAVVGVILLVVVGFAVAAFVGFGTSVTNVAVEEFESSGEAGFDGGGEINTGAAVRPGQQVRATVPAGGHYEMELVLDEAQPVILDVRGRQGFDAVLEVTDGAGERLGYNDDRSGPIGDADTFDPLLELDLDAGTYRVIVRGFGGSQGAFELRTS